jgi:hypothetical protein
MSVAVAALLAVAALTFVGGVFWLRRTLRSILPPREHPSFGVQIDIGGLELALIVLIICSTVSKCAG